MRSEVKVIDSVPVLMAVMTPSIQFVGAASFAARMRVPTESAPVVPTRTSVLEPVAMVLEVLDVNPP
jgi:hypothetical protein